MKPLGEDYHCNQGVEVKWTATKKGRNQLRSNEQIRPSVLPPPLIVLLGWVIVHWLVWLSKSSQWQGLGFHRRARPLKNGRVSDSVSAALGLPSWWSLACFLSLSPSVGGLRWEQTRKKRWIYFSFVFWAIWWDGSVALNTYVNITNSLYVFWFVFLAVPFCEQIPLSTQHYQSTMTTKACSYFHQKSFGDEIPDLFLKTDPSREKGWIYLLCSKNQRRWICFQILFSLATGCFTKKNRLLSSVLSV